MPDFEPGTWGKVLFALYYVAGLPIAWFFMKQQDMEESSQDSESHRYVVVILAIMWPVLLFAMFVNWLQGPDGSPKSRPDREERADRKPKPDGNARKKASSE